MNGHPERPSCSLSAAICSLLSAFSPQSQRPLLPPARRCARSGEAFVISCGGNRHLDAQSEALRFDLQPSDLLAQRPHVRVEVAHVLTRTSALLCGGAALPSLLPLLGEILLSQ